MIHTRIQHHPSRAHLLPELQERLGMPAEVIEDTAGGLPSPWRGYQACLSNIPECSHLLVVQDDAVPCVNFAPAVEQIAAAKPDEPVCLFLARIPREASMKAERMIRRFPDQRYVQLSWRNFLPVVAVLWPRHKAIEFKEWSEAHPQLPGQRAPRSDDAMAGVWKMRERQTVWATVPSLVEHPDVEPSIIGKRAQAGADKNRVAVFLAQDGLDYDWSA